MNFEVRIYSQRCYIVATFRVRNPWILCLPSPTEASQPTATPQMSPVIYSVISVADKMEKKVLRFHNYYHLQVVSKEKTRLPFRVNKKCFIFIYILQVAPVIHKDKDALLHKRHKVYWYNRAIGYWANYNFFERRRVQFPIKKTKVVATQLLWTKWTL